MTRSPGCGSTGRTSRRTAGLGAVLAVAGALIAPGAAAHTPRAPADFFGLNAQGIGTSPYPRDNASALAQNTNSIASLGIDLIRVNFDWREAEGIAPIGGVHSYNWAGFDTLVAQAARSGLRVYPDLAGTPSWATSADRIVTCTASLAHPGPTDVAAYAAYAGAVAERYGPNGTFWAQNPGVPYQPILQIELWNEPNWTFWCPAPEPEAYAQMLELSADAIRAASPGIEAVLGGLVIVKAPVAPSYAMATDQFLNRVFAARPALAQKLGAVGVHPYDADPEDVLAKIAWARRSLDAAGGAALPLDVNEFGWPTQGDDSAIDEEPRASYVGELAHQLWRTDCGIERIFVHTWRTQELLPTDREQWFGIADPGTAAPYPTARAYSDELRLATGAGSEPAPRSLVRLCGGAAPDRDGDGSADPDDDYPLDPSRDSGSGEQSPEDLAAPPARLHPPRVPDTFFGVDGGSTWSGDQVTRRQRMDAIASQGFGSYRIAADWATLQPTATTAPSSIDWAALDSQVRHAANRHMQPRLYEVSKPSWAGTEVAAVSSSYAAFLRALVARYGPGGAFWAENPGLPYLPARDWEVWNGAQQSSTWWDGSAAPGEYALAYTAAKTALNEVDPGARALVSAYRDLGGYTAASWIQQMGIAVDGAAVDARLVPGNYVEAMLANVRTALGPGKPITPIVGLNTGGPSAYTEAQRSQIYDSIGRRLAVSNCGIDTTIFYAWTTPEQNTDSKFDWMGLAPPASPDALYASALTLGSLVDLFGGWSSADAPRDPALICGPTPPDGDGDGVPDASDNYPLDPARSSGTDPAPVITSAPPARSYSRSADFAFVRSSPQPSAFHCRLDGGTWEDCSAGTRSYEGLGDGSHTFSVRALDSYDTAAGPTSYTWKVNPPPLAAPQITFATSPVQEGASAEFRFTGEAGASFECRLDGGALSACSSPARYSGLAPGQHTFEVRQVIGDERSPFASRGFSVDQAPQPPSPAPPEPPPDGGGGDGGGGDTTPPVVTIDRVKAKRKAARIFFSADEPASFECRLDSGDAAPCTSPVRFKRLKRGRHRLEVTATDDAGNSATATAKFKLKKRRR